MFPNLNHLAYRMDALFFEKSQFFSTGPKICEFWTRSPEL